MHPAPQDSNSLDPRHASCSAERRRREKKKLIQSYPSAFLVLCVYVMRRRERAGWREGGEVKVEGARSNVFSKYVK